jgi:hypothetical protein
VLVEAVTGLRLVPLAAVNPDLIILLTATEAAIATSKGIVRRATWRLYLKIIKLAKVRAMRILSAMSFGIVVALLVFFAVAAIDGLWFQKPSTKNRF